MVKYFIEVHTSEAEMTAGTNANVFITLYGSQSDSGRRHLIHNKEARKRFQAGQVSRYKVRAPFKPQFWELRCLGIPSRGTILIRKYLNPSHRGYSKWKRFVFKVNKSLSFKDGRPYLFHSFRNKYFNKISLGNMLYFQNKL